MFEQPYPNVMGCDVAGEIVEVGSSVTKFKKGDRVAGHACQLMDKTPREGAFQLYTICPAVLTVALPDHISYDAGTVLPLAISTAAAGMYQKDHLGLPLPSTSPKSSGKTLLIWGGSSSVGSTAIQLAKASGLEIFTTASKHNHDYCKKLGAHQVFDHTQSSVVDDIVAAAKGKTLVGAYDAIATGGTTEKCAEVLDKANGTKMIATVLPGPENLPGGAKSAGVFALTIRDNEVGPAVWGDFLPGALKSGYLTPHPEPLVIGTGLESIQKGMNKNKEGVSAKKVVISLA